MINPTFSNTLTVFHQEKYFDEETKKNVTKWVKTIFKNCFYKMQGAETLNGTTLSQASGYIARIPYKGKSLNIVPGDIIVKGIVEDEEDGEDIIQDVQGKRVSDLLNKFKPDCFTVRAVSGNIEIPEGAHYKVTGV